MNMQLRSGEHYVADKYHLGGLPYRRGSARFNGAWIGAFNGSDMNPTKQNTSALVTWAKCKRYAYHAPKNDFPWRRQDIMTRSRFFLFVAFRLPVTHPNK
jgi:hypothetical protein